jgi:hypothetical protein
MCKLNVHVDKKRAHGPQNEKISLQNVHPYYINLKFGCKLFRPVFLSKSQKLKYLTRTKWFDFEILSKLPPILQ